MSVTPLERRATASSRRGRLLGQYVLASVALTVALASPAGASAAKPTPPRTPTATAAAVLAGSIGLRLVDVPVAARDDPRARVYIVDHLAPGAVIHRRIEVSNTTPSTMHVVLYPAAATIANGSFLGSAGRTANELSTWASVRSDTGDVAAGGRMTASVTIAIPRDAAPGERYGVIWAETRSASGAGGGGGITEVSRVGIRLYVSVGPGGPPASDFAIRSLTAERSGDGQPIVVATVHNDGGRALDLNGTLQLSDGPAGLSAGPFAAALGTTLAIGATEPVTIALDTRLPAGPWDARITLHSGLLERSAEAKLTFSDTGKAAAVSAGPARRGLPRYAIEVALLGLAAGVTVVRRRKRRRTNARARRSTPTEVLVARGR